MAKNEGKARSRMPVVRVLLTAALFGLSLLVVVPAPTSKLWLVAIGVTEWGYWLVPLGLVALWGIRGGSGWDLIRLTLAVATIVLLLLPLVRAVGIAARLPGELERAFDLKGSSVEAPLNVGRLFRTDPALTDLPDLVSFESGSGILLEMDLYRPRTQPRRAAVLVVHGGSWQSGTRFDFPELNIYLAGRGFLVASTDYRLAPQWRYPAAADDVRAALRYLRAHADELGIDPARIVLLGRSAGGQLALLVAYTEADIAGVIGIYPPTDLLEAYAHPSNPAVLDSRGILEAYLGGPPTSVPTAYRDASPITHVGNRTPPTLLIHGRRDELVFATHSVRLEERLRDAGQPRYYLELPWATHGCDVHLHGPCGQLATYAIDRFLEHVTTR